MPELDLPLFFVGVIALSVLLYVVLDGFDLGVGILFPFARSPADRDVMMNTVAPVWDGNETWLVLGGNVLLAAFPVAFAVLMPALYLPILIMLVALILRGVAFEFRFRARLHGRALWTAMFSFGSLLTAFAQGLILGGFIQGIEVENGRFAGGPLDWLTPYTLLVGFGVVAGYALLGACWIVMKTEDELHGDGRKWAWWSGVAVMAFLGAVSIATVLVHPQVASRWGLPGFLADDRAPGPDAPVATGIEAATELAAAPDRAVDLTQLLPLLSIPALGLVGFAIMAWGLHRKAHRLPFFGAFLIFLSGYIGLAVSFTPYIAPYGLTYEQAAAAPNTLSLMLVIVSVMMPLILGYTAWVYFVFRGKVRPDAGYH
jgi:cytochrome d ubiquinol oxidase subunit II